MNHNPPTDFQLLQDDHFFKIISTLIGKSIRSFMSTFRIFFKKCQNLEALTWKAASLEEFPNLSDFEVQCSYGHSPDMWKKGFMDGMSCIQSKTIFISDIMADTGSLPFEMDEGKQWCLKFSADRSDRKALSVYIIPENIYCNDITLRVEVKILNSKGPSFSRKRVHCCMYNQWQHWGWSKFLPLDYFEDASYGFLSEDGKIKFQLKFQWGWMEAGLKAGMPENVVHSPHEAYCWYQQHLCSLPESEDGWCWESTNSALSSGELVLVSPAERKWLDFWEKHVQSPADQKENSRRRLLKVLRANKSDFSRSEKFLEEDRHVGIICDVCAEHDFQGMRMKCEICKNYDLCGKCYQSEKQSLQHTTGHPTKQVEPYLKIWKP